MEKQTDTQMHQQNLNILYAMKYLASNLLFSSTYCENLNKEIEDKIARIEEVLFQNVDDKFVFTTVGVYQNQDYVINGVSAEHLASHIEYNCKFRFGRALFLNGKCIHSGYLSAESVIEWEKKIADNPKNFVQTKCNAPYR